MSILTNTLKEELKTAKRLEKKYLEKLSLIPRGSFFVRKLKSGEFGYLTFRAKGAVRQKYLGKLTIVQIAEYKETKRKKVLYKKQLKQVREQIKILKRALGEKTT